MRTIYVPATKSKVLIRVYETHRRSHPGVRDTPALPSVKTKQIVDVSFFIRDACLSHTSLLATHISQISLVHVILFLSGRTEDPNLDNDFCLSQYVFATKPFLLFSLEGELCPTFRTKGVIRLLKLLL